MRFSAWRGHAAREKTHAKRVMSTYLIVDSTPCDGVFITNLAFLFSSLSDYFPWELIRTLASLNKKPDHIEYDRVSFYSMHGY